MATNRSTPNRRAVMAGLAAAPVVGFPAIAGAVTDADPIVAAFANFERAKTAEALASEASDDLREVTERALYAAGINPTQILTRRRLEEQFELGFCSAADYKAGLAALEGPEDEHQAMLRAVEELDEPAKAAWEAQSDAERELFTTAPTTRAGAFQLLRHLADFLDEDDVVNDNVVGDAVGDAIRNAAAVLEQEARS